MHCGFSIFFVYGTATNKLCHFFCYKFIFEKAKQISLIITTVRLQHGSDIATYNACLFLNNTVVRLQHISMIFEL
jgi:hypothetical protein